MSELEIKSIIENCKVSKATKESLLQLGRKNDAKFQSMEKEINNLKSQYETKIKELEISIQSTQKTHEEVYKKQTTEKSLDHKISSLNESFIKFKTEFCKKFDNFEKKLSMYAEASTNSFQKQPDFISNIDSKLSLVTHQINAETERKLKEKKSLNVIVFNIPENISNTSVYTVENAKNDLNKIQSSLGSNKIAETELNTLYRIGKYNCNKTRPIILKLLTQSSRKRLLSLRNLKIQHLGKQISIYINIDRTKSEMEHFRKLRFELKQKQAEAESKNLNIRYVIKQNKIVESTQLPFRFNAQDLWA